MKGKFNELGNAIVKANKGGKVMEDNNIVDFEQKKNEKYKKQFANDSNEIAEMIIDACFADGQDDYDLAVLLLTGGISVTDEHEPLDRTLRSLQIERIARKGYEKQANELRKRMSNMIDEETEKND